MPSNVKCITRLIRAYDFRSEVLIYLAISLERNISSFFNTPQIMHSSQSATRSYLVLSANLYLYSLILPYDYLFKIFTGFSLFGLRVPSETSHLVAVKDVETFSANTLYNAKCKWKEIKIS